MDEIDRASQEEENTLANILRKRLPPGPVATGRCLFCDELVEETHRWCSIECRADWEREARRGVPGRD